jgi:hypothetical protein
VPQLDAPASTGWGNLPRIEVDDTPNAKGPRRNSVNRHLVVVAPFQSLDEIAAAANDSPYGLGAGIWTKDISKAHSLAKRIRAGTVWINCYNIFDAALPFGGYKQSGWGREMGHEALDAYTEVKAVCAQLEALARRAPKRTRLGVWRTAGPARQPRDMSASGPRGGNSADSTPGDASVRD